MLSGDFERKLRALNPRIRIYAADTNRAAGIYIVSPYGEYTEICGADKNYVPEFVMYSDDGRIVKSGWRRILKILIGKGLVHKEKAEKVFNTHLDGTRAPKRKALKHDPDLSKLASMGIDIISEGSF